MPVVEVMSRRQKEAFLREERRWPISQEGTSTSTRRRGEGDHEDLPSGVQNDHPNHQVGNDNGDDGDVLTNEVENEHEAFAEFVERYRPFEGNQEDNINIIGSEGVQGGPPGDPRPNRDFEEMLTRERATTDAAWEEIKSLGSSLLYEGARASVLAYVLMLLDWAATYHVSNVAMEKLFAMLHSKFMPVGNTAPPSRAVARKVLKKIGMDYQMVHVCRDDCMLFEGEDKELTACRVCKKPRYRDDVQGSKVPWKVRSLQAFEWSVML